MPPWVITACSQAWKPASAARYLAALASAPHSRPWSYRLAAFSIIRLADSSSAQFFASGCWVGWFLPGGGAEPPPPRGFLGGRGQCPPADTDGLGRQQHALGVQAVDDGAEPLAF